MSVIVSDAIFLRRPKFDYISPPVCETFISGSSFPICVANAIALPAAPTGLTIECFDAENATLTWAAHPLALKYTIYKADNSGEPDGSYSIFADCVEGTSFTVPCLGCYRVSAITLDGESELSDPICGNHTPPIVILGPTENLACLEGVTGTVNPGGENAEAWFEWGLTSSYGNEGIHQLLGSGFFDIPVDDILPGLTIGTTYHFRLVATNALGTTYSPDATFTAADPIFPTISSATCMARWEADSITAADLGGTPSNKIMTWPDVSGFGRTAHAVLNAQRPYFIENYFGCKPAVFLSIGGGSQMDFVGTPLSTFTTFVVWNLTLSHESFFGPLSWMDNPGTGDRFWMGVPQALSASNPPKRLFLLDPVGNRTEFLGPDEGLNLPTTPRGNAVDTYSWNGSVCRFRKNGQEQVVSPAGTSGFLSGLIYSIGMNPAPIEGYIGAIIVFDGALTDPEILSVENYLNIKYPSY